MKYAFLLPVERKFIEGLMYEAPLHMSFPDAAIMVG
jgi:hypothetical protein